MSPTIRNGRRELEVFDMHPTDHRPEPVALVTRARPVLPCESCLHAPICSIRQAIDIAALEVRAPASPNEALRIGIRIDVECRHYLIAPEVVPAAPARLDDLAAARRRGTEGSRTSRAAVAAKPAQPAQPAPASSSTRHQKSPETRERMRQAQLARAARLRAEREASAKGATA
ncbi:MAG TPA: hypothetical protein VFI34_07735 [Candidatus Limnocylindrales bacterium]|nr:hypothetical protein [Candidatus Limnocylindrales bacterium]